VSQLVSYGWSSWLQREFEPFAARGFVPGRVVEERRAHHRVVGDAGERLAVVGGALRREADAGAAWPTVGDWVALEVPPGAGAAVVRGVLERRSALVRRDVSGGGNRGQVLAAGVDVVLVVAAANLDFNPARIARYVALAWEGGAQPVVVLSKIDLADDADALVRAAEAAAPGAPVVAVSATEGVGLEALAPHLVPRATAVLVGSSGAGKSTLLNRLAGEDRQAVRAIREDDDRGRHTTTSRHLFALPSGALVIDTPGLREVGLWESADGVRAAFSDVEDVAASCRFRDCRHETEPACAVLAAVASGALASERLASWRKLVRELAFQARKADRRLAAERRRANRRRDDP
jgi:ribosome biogenesis GTPase